VEGHKELPSPQFKPLERRAWLAARWIGFTGALALGILGLNVAYLSALGHDEDSTGIARLVDLGYIVQFGIHVLGAALFLAWFYRAYSNAPALGVPFLRHNRGWAVAAWFVPIIALVWPKRMANDAWRASDPELPANDADWLKRPVAPFIHLWWAAWLCANFADNAWSRLDPTTVEGLRGATILAIAGQAAYVLAAALCILFVRRLTAREEAKARADVPVLELSDDERAAAAQAALGSAPGVARRLGWYAALAFMFLVAVAVAVDGHDGNSAVTVGEVVGYLIVAILIGVAVVQIAGRISRRRPALTSGWAALVAVAVMVAVASAKLGGQAAGTSASGAAASGQTAADTGASACPVQRFRLGRLPAGYSYSQLRPHERREMLDEMRLPKEIERQTVIVYVNHRGRAAALVTAMPNGGQPDAFVKGAVAEARRTHRHGVETKQLGVGTLLVTPETYSGIVSTACTSVTVMGPTQRVVSRLMEPVARA
jgi:hypothetical protein